MDSIIKCDLSGLIKQKSNENIHICCKTLDYLYNNDWKTEFLKDNYHLAKKTQRHKCNIIKCKLYKQKKCKFGFGENNLGKELCKKTNVTKHGNLQIKRLNRHINEYNIFILVSLRCNHDIKFVANDKNKSLSVLYYLTNYITKSGLSSYNALTCAITPFNKLNKYKIINSNNNEQLNAQKIMNSLYNAVANKTEYSGAQVGAMINNIGQDGTYYCSHKTATLNIWSLYNKINNVKSNDYKIIPDKIEEDLSIYDYFYDYRMRPKELEMLNLYNFVSSYIKKKNKTLKHH